MLVLAADIGGTKTLLSIADAGADRIEILHERRYLSADYAEFETMVEEFLASCAGDKPQRACFAVAGPITADGTSAHVTNVGWHLDVARMQTHLGIASIQLINDFQAQAYGIDVMQPEELHELQAGVPQPQGLRAVIGAGTGLGVGQLVWRDGRYHALPSEGGHADFSPHGALAREQHAWLGARYGDYIPLEFVISGPGLADTYRFLAERHPKRASAKLAHAMLTGDPAAAISEHAAHEELAREALGLFIHNYGTHASNLALTTLPYGGLFISGGIAPRILDAMAKNNRFINAFNAKGRMSTLARSIPVAVVTNPRVGLLGALDIARGE
ncbi:MAG: glucokinase [Chromatiales bacterium]|jgi:glucokinase|nr:glucokinase [Chromatiales bacterium]